MERYTFRREEVIAFVEDLIRNNAASDAQEEMYLKFTWDNKLNKNNYTYKKTLKQMKRIYNGF